MSHGCQHSSCPPVLPGSPEEVDPGLAALYLCASHSLTAIYHAWYLSPLPSSFPLPAVGISAPKSVRGASGYVTMLWWGGSGFMVVSLLFILMSSCCMTLCKTALPHE